MKRHNWKRTVVPLLLISCMSINLTTSTALAKDVEEDQTEEPVWEVTDELSETSVAAEEVTETEEEYDPEEELRVFIVFDEEAVVDAGYSTEDLAENEDAMAYSEEITKQQEETVEQISDEALDGEDLDVRYNFTILTNALSANVKYEDIDKIKEVEGVSDVYITPQYDVEETADINTMTAGTMIGSYDTWESGYTGAGQRIAIIDTGIDSDHPSFDGDAFDYSLNETAEEEGTLVDAYNLLDEDEIATVLPELNAAAMYQDLSAEDLFLSEKIAYAFNYVDENLDVTHDNDSEGDHGTHVSGIACANLYVPTTDAAGTTTYEEQETGVVGVAPDAQLLTMKVFGTNGGAYSDDYMAAIEDAILLKADAINLSLGSSSAGNSAASEAYINEIFDKLQGTDTVVSISAGNAGAWSDDSEYGANLASDVNLDTVGSPGSYTNAFTVASAVNSGYTGYSVTFDENITSYYDDGSGSPAAAFATLDTSETGTGTEYEYVLLTGTGTEADFEDVDVTGKIVLVKRGDISFYVKHMNAAAAGAAGVLVYNNTSGAISMNLAGSTSTIPCASITQSDALSVMEEATKISDTVYTGKIVIGSKVTTNYNAADGYTMSDFSSWGVPDSLELKPEITAPGGNIYSTLDDGAYGLMSGTSMAAPSVAGMSALVAQYIKENNLTEKTGLSVRTLSQSLLMSTAVPLVEEDGEEYSPRNQGAGLANVEYATTSPVYILLGDVEENDGKVKAELGDDPEKTGIYSFDFNLYNMTDQTQYYTSDSSILTEELVEDYFVTGTSHQLSPDVVISSSEQQYLYDLNLDGMVDYEDAATLLSYVNGSVELSVVDFYQDAFDFNADGVVNTADVHDFLSEIKTTSGETDLTQKVIAVKDMTKVTVTITLSDADRNYLESSFENGMYVDGYIYLRGTVDLSIPLLAFYGSWADSSMFEPFDFLEYANNEETWSTYSGVEYTNYLTYSYAGSSAKYYYTSNMYSESGDEVYLSERNAFSSASGDSIQSAYYSLIRNASRVITSVIDANTGEVYLSTESTNKSAEYYYATDDSWQSTMNSATLNWKGTDASGNALPEDTEVEISVTAIPSYYDDVDVSEITGNGLSLTVPMVIDNTSPSVTEMVDADETGKMDVTVLDNRYVANISIYDSDKKTLVSSYDVNQVQKGVASVVTIDCPTSVFYVRVYDYAGNYTTYRVNNSGAEDTAYAESISLDKTTLNIVKGGTAQLTASVLPVTLLDDSVTWSSSDETVATVDANGIITALGEGTATITATTVAKDGTDGESLSAACEVTVETIGVTLDGVVWDENGEVYWSDFNTADLTAIHKKSAAQGNRYMSATEVDGKIIAATYGSSQSSELYLIDPVADYSATSVLSGLYWCTDLAYSASSSLLYATYGPYVQIMSNAGSALLGNLTFDGNFYSDYFIGITYVGTVTLSAGDVDVLYAVTKSGALYQIIFNASLGYDYEKLGDLNIGTSGSWYFNSLYYDEDTDYFFLSMYDGGNNAVLYAIKENYNVQTSESSYQTYELGSFEDGVWPIAGLFQGETSSDTAAAERVRTRGTLALEPVTLEQTVPELIDPIKFIDPIKSIDPIK